MSFELPRYFFPALLLTFAVAEYLSSPHYYSAFEFERSPCFQKLIACSDTKPATQCLAEHGERILLQAKPVLTNVGFQAAQVCVDQVKRLSFQDSEVLLNVQRCFYLAEMFALSPYASVQKPLFSARSFSRTMAEVPIFVYLVAVFSVFYVLKSEGLFEKISSEPVYLRIEKWLEDMISELHKSYFPALQTLMESVSAVEGPVRAPKVVKMLENEGSCESSTAKPSLPRSFPCSVHGLSRFLEIEEDFPSLSDQSSSIGSITVCSEEDVIVEKVKPSFDISKESGRAAMRAYVEKKMRDNNYKKPLPNVRYREVPRRDSHHKRLRRVFIPRRGWVSLRRIEMEEYQDGRNALVRPG